MASNIGERWLLLSATSR